MDRMCEALVSTTSIGVLVTLTLPWANCMALASTEKRARPLPRNMRRVLMILLRTEWTVAKSSGPSDRARHLSNDTLVLSRATINVILFMRRSRSIRAKRVLRETVSTEVAVPMLRKVPWPPMTKSR